MRRNPCKVAFQNFALVILTVKLNMLYAKFNIGDDRYLIAINQIAAIIPYVYLKKIPLMPNYAAGLLDYHGLSIPVIDLSQFLIDRSCVRMLSTRIIISTIKSSRGGDEITVGFLVENATETFSVDENEFVDPGMKNSELPFIGLVVSDDEGMITKISPQDIFGNLDESLFFTENVSAKNY